MAAEPRKRLGRGLDALLGADTGAAAAKRGTAASDASRLIVPIAAVEPNPRNPRREFDADDLADLAASIAAHGIVQPIVVRPSPLDGEGGRYEIVAGERRWRAAEMAGRAEVPILVVEVSDREALELAIVENVQRADLNPIEEAMGYQALIDEFGYTQGDLGRTIGKSRVHVTNTIRLLKLPESVRADVTAGRLSAGHARAIVSARDPERLARRIIAKGMNVRDAERLAQESGEEKPRTPRRAVDSGTRALEREFGEATGLKASLKPGPDGAGELRLRYASLDQLDVLRRRLMG